MPCPYITNLSYLNLPTVLHDIIDSFLLPKLLKTEDILDEDPFLWSPINIKFLPKFIPFHCVVASGSTLYHLFYWLRQGHNILCSMNHVRTELINMKIQYEAECGKVYLQIICECKDDFSYLLDSKYVDDFADIWGNISNNYKYWECRYWGVSTLKELERALIEDDSFLDYSRHDSSDDETDEETETETTET